MIRFMIILPAVSFLFSIQATASETITLAAFEYPPYEYQEGDTVDGLNVRLVKTVFSKMNQPVSITLLPWTRGLKYLEFGEIDGFFSVIKTDKRSEYADFSNEVLINETIYLFVSQTSDIAFSGDLSALKAYRFGVRQDFSHGSRFDNAVTDGILPHIIKTTKPSHIFLQLDQGDIDIIVGDQYYLPYLHKRYKTTKKRLCTLEKIKKLYPALQTTATFIAFSKKKHLAELRDQFDAMLVRIKKNGIYDETIKTWVKENVATN